MSDLWSKPDNKCYNCDKPLPIGEGKTEKVFGKEYDMSYNCECGEYNGWQDPKVGKIMSFICWMGRKNF